MADGVDPALLPLLQRLRGGENDADWAILVARVRPDLRAICSQRLGHGLLVEDAVQETLLRCRNALTAAEWPDEATAWAWMRRIAANTASSLASAEQARHRRERRVGSESGRLAAATSDDDGELRALVESRLATLPARQRQALELRYRQGLDVPSAAARMGMDPVNFRALSHRALQAVRQRLGART